ncbi:hypothetical protein RHAL1_01856 [Beijerinckiaceae bacterium RH AL1]|jgi:hypothetical protein|nr:DUF2155 domain-containing protein [Beijerinckiaceae bacterium]VVB45608.1 hypothetical protein RHCH11_RHCH11_01818 [Beijerinckiaceae bacterium RH CH11]VVB45683.1 hypothetical protein RHAL8_01814 [Beijerinckiaceae bacterium RH AL8]VVC54950.1 hypothetical protein RHAL1_01856 [Beijerinckiaceae bacterium RH AL1]
MTSKTLIRTACAACSLIALAAPARADRISHPTAVFSGLDKITGRIISFEVATNETVQFGSLQITEKACYTRPATEAPQTTTFAQVDEIDAKKQYKRIFSGWMFASSPGLNGIEHPVYDIWLTDCKGGKEIQKTPETASTEPAAGDKAADAAKTGDAGKAADQTPKPERKHRVAKRKPTPQQDDAAGMTPDDAAPRRQPPARSFFPDAANNPDGGFY